MADPKITIIPGINNETTGKDSIGRWKDGNNVRFHKSQPQKLGGAVELSATTFLGACRGLINWISLASAKLTALGTHRKFYVYIGGDFNNITPLRDSTSAPFSSSVLSNPFSTTSASVEVVVAHTGHGQTLGSFVSFSNTTASPIDSTLIDGEYEVTEVIGVNSFKIEIPSAATTTEANFGDASVDYDYQINPGEESTIALFGWGSDGYGEGGYGQAGASSSETAEARIWHLDTFGEDLIANIRGANLYSWDTSVGVTTANVLKIVTNAPTEINVALVSPSDRTLIAFGCNDPTSGDFDPLLIRWTDRETLTVWAPTDTNTAGGFRLGRGSEIVGATGTRGQIIILTDSSAHNMYPTQDEFIYGLTHLADGCGLVGPHALVERNGIVYWMSKSNFYMYDGVVTQIPCDVWSHVFKDLNLDQKIKFHTGLNSDWNEIWFFYCTAGSDEIDKVAIYNTEEKWWSVGDFAYTAWAHDDELFPNPHAASATNLLWGQENGVDKGSDPLPSFLESSDIEIEGGAKFLHVKRLFPDFKRLIGCIAVSLKAKKHYQGAVIKTKGPEPVTSSTKYINLRARGKVIAIRMETTALGDDWQSGEWTAEAYPHGGR